MSRMSRRQWLKGLLASLAAAGTVVCCRAVLPVAEAGTEQPQPTPEPQQRADQLAAELPPSPDGLEPIAFLNRSFRNGGGFGGGFGGGWRNVGLGGFGGFRNGGWKNVGFGGGLGWPNGGWRNVGWRNW
jgi:hypothetical protein